MNDIAQEQELVMEEYQEKPKRKGGFGLGSIVLLASIVIAAVIIGVALVRQSATQPLSGPAPVFEFTTFDGATYNLQDFRGKVVVINFWASWCAPCAYEAPELQSAWEYYRDRDVVFIGIAYADNGPKSLEFMARYDIDYLNAPDLGTTISEQYHIVAVPETFIIDQNGNIVQFYYSAITEAQLSEVIDPLLERGAQ